MENLIKYIITHTTMKEEEAAGYAYDIMCCLKDGDKAQADFLLSSILYLNPPGITPGLQIYLENLS